MELRGFRRVLGATSLSMFVLPLLPTGATPAAAEATVTMRLTRFVPQELRIEPGDRVTWTNNEAQVHDVTSNVRGQFSSPDLGQGETFTRTFNNEGYFYYFCSFHGSRDQVGMWGVVVVGDPPPPTDPGGGGSGRQKLVVPRDFRTISEAITAARPGAKIVIEPGKYREPVVIDKPGITLKGKDRFMTVLHGGDELQNGITVTGTEDAEIKNLTVRNFRRAGVFINDTKGYLVHKVDSIKNRTYGIYAFDSHEGVFRRSFSYGSGESAFYVGQCLSCSALLDRVKAKKSFLGYSGTNATGVVILESTFADNGVGIVPNSFPEEDYAPNRGTTIVGNTIKSNNYDSVPHEGMSSTFGLPYGTGIWLWGVQNAQVTGNTVSGHDRYGILVTPSHDEQWMARNNRITENKLALSGEYDLVIDGGADNCVRDNSLAGRVLPGDALERYLCSKRPFSNDDLDAFRAALSQMVESPSQKSAEPPEPKRPKCQRGKPWCKHP